jgi:transposase InsO family protein
MFIYNKRKEVLFHPLYFLTDNNLFKEEWDKWCKANGIEPLYAHPYYPQDKGKIERAIRNFVEEFVYLLKKFPEWLDVSEIILHDEIRRLKTPSTTRSGMISEHVKNHPVRWSNYQNMPPSKRVVFNGKIKEYQTWFNKKRFHSGINAIPYELYT